MLGKGLASAVLTMLALDAQAGIIRGHFRVAESPHRALPGETMKTSAGPEEAVVWVDSIPPSVARFYRPGSRRARVIQSHRRFARTVTTVTVGSTIRFANQDKVYHNVFSVSPARRFDLGKFPPRSSRQVTFERPGVVNLFCDIHPWMAAYVVVLPHRVFARPDRKGQFRLPWLPAGHYRLHAWHPSRGERMRDIDVPERGDVVVELSD